MTSDTFCAVSDNKRIILFALFSLLSEETLRASSLEQLGVIFNRNFTKVDHFRVGMALVSVLWTLLLVAVALVLSHMYTLSTL